MKDQKTRIENETLMEILRREENYMEAVMSQLAKTPVDQIYKESKYLVRTVADQRKRVHQLSQALEAWNNVHQKTQKS